MELNGTIVHLGATETIGAKGFKKRQVVIKTNEQYPQTIPVDFTQDKVNILDNYKVNDIVSIGINIRGSEWQGKFYANIQGWKINNAEKEMSANTFMPDRQVQDNPELDNLPF